MQARKMRPQAGASSQTTSTQVRRQAQAAASSLPYIDIPVGIVCSPADNIGTSINILLGSCLKHLTARDPQKAAKRDPVLISCLSDYSIVARA